MQAGDDGGLGQAGSSGGAWIWAIMERRSQRDVMAALGMECERTKEQQGFLQGGCGEKRTCLHGWWECELVQALWKTVWKFL